MTPDQLAIVLVCGASGALVGAGLARVRVAAPPETLVRENYRGRRVPAVLGEGVIAGGACGLAVALAASLAGIDGAPEYRALMATGILLLVFGGAGLWDDRKGDERPRGFKGHLGALRTGRLTGGIVKLVAGGVAGLAAGVLVVPTPVAALRTGLLIALTANLVNLFDRAPGRAAKVALVLAAPVFPVAPVSWVMATAGAFAALGAVLPFDLKERGMLGDAGANPIGALAGLGLALALSPVAAWVAVVIALAGNILSERWSFSRIIDRTPVLKAMDRWGRES